MDLETPSKAGRPAFPGGPARIRRPQLGGRGVTRGRAPIHGPTLGVRYASLFAYLFQYRVECSTGPNARGLRIPPASKQREPRPEQLGWFP
jgi:hypothetical protein